MPALVKHFVILGFEVLFKLTLYLLLLLLVGFYCGSIYRKHSLLLMAALYQSAAFQTYQEIYAIRCETRQLCETLLMLMLIDV